MEQEDSCSNQNRTERDVSERERNDLAEGPRSRTERNHLKKVGTCPALPAKLGLL